MPLPTPFLHFKCNDNSANTTVTNNGTSGNNGSTGGVDTNTISVTGKINQAFDIDSAITNSYLFASHSAGDVNTVKTDTTGTHALWINPDIILGSQTLVGLGQTTASNGFLKIYINSSGNIVVEIVDNNVTLLSVQSTTTISSGSFYHVVIVQDGISIKIYINAVDVTGTITIGTGTEWHNSVTVNPFERWRYGINANAGSGGFLNGKVDDCRYYNNVALSATQVSSLYFGGSGQEGNDDFILAKKSQGIIII